MRGPEEREKILKGLPEEMARKLREAEERDKQRLRKLTERLEGIKEEAQAQIEAAKKAMYDPYVLKPEQIRRVKEIFAEREADMQTNREQLVAALHKELGPERTIAALVEHGFSPEDARKLIRKVTGEG